GEDFIVIPGTKRAKYLEENWGANAVTVTDAEDAEIREIINSITVHGTRHEEWGMKQLNL
ncbi:hypothetical protein BDK51DRAFT_17178, partial [Blyttiomyces helicus]